MYLCQKSCLKIVLFLPNIYEGSKVWLLQMCKYLYRKNINLYVVSHIIPLPRWKTWRSSMGQNKNHALDVAFKHRQSPIWFPMPLILLVWPEWNFAQQSQTHFYSRWTAWLVSSFLSTRTPSPSHHSCSHQVLLLVWTHVWDCPEPGVALCIWICWTKWNSYGPASQVCPCPMDGIPSFCCDNYTAQLHGS